MADERQGPSVLGGRAGRRANQPAGRRAGQRAGQRADFGASIHGFFEKQPPTLRAILEELRSLILEAVPGAQSSIKWGNPWFTVDGVMVCALTAHKAHINLILAGPAQAFTDPEHRLEGTSENGRHLKLMEVSQIPRESVLEWVRTAAALAKKGAT